MRVCAQWMSGREDVVWLTSSAVAVVAISYAVQPVPASKLVLLLPALAAFVVRGLVDRMPPELFATLVMLPVGVVVADGERLEGTFFLVTVMVLFVSWRTPSVLRTGTIAAVAAVEPFVVNQILGAGHEIGWVSWTTASVFTFSMGRLLRSQVLLIEELKRARGELAELAVAEERRRIARELHDLAGHTLAAVLLHVTGARHVLRRDIDEAERALLDAETVGRWSLDQIRTAVETLRTDESGTDAPLASGADLVALFEEYRRAGLRVSASIAAPARRLEGPVAVALHRITREALANVARHAPGNEVEVTVNGSGHEVHLIVADHGGRPTSADPSSPTFGILGMRERARALGGALDAGPTGDGWTVDARLPLLPS